MDWEQASKLLKEDLSSKVIKTRSGGGNKQLSYIDHFEAIDAANRIFGHGGWSRMTLENRQVSNDPVAYVARVRIKVGDVVRDGCGYGNGFGKDAHELAWKEAETDATKRALMTFGYPLGLALYQKDGMEHVSDGNGHAEPEPVGKVIRLPDNLDHTEGKSGAQSNDAWKLLDYEMRQKNKNTEDLNLWYVQKQPTLKKGMNNATQWDFFENVIKYGLTLEKTSTDANLFWISHKTRLAKLAELDITRYEGLEDHLMQRITQLASPDATLEIRTPLDAG